MASKYSSVATGTSQDDVFTFTKEAAAGELVAGSLGYDTVRITGAGGYDFALSNFYRLSRIEVIDLSGLTGTVTASVTPELLQQAEGRKLTLISGASGIARLSAPADALGKVIIAGEGHVFLDDSSDNSVSIRSQSVVVIHGGNGEDTISAGDGGAILDGGIGNDILIAGVGEGIETIIVAHGGGDDYLLNFDAEEDTIDLTQTSIESLAQISARVTLENGSTVIDLGHGDSLTINGVGLDDLTLPNFSFAELTSPTSGAGGTIAAGPGISARALNALIASAPKGAVIELQDGAYEFDEAILIHRSDITLKGESEAGTILKFGFAAGHEDNAIQVLGGWPQDIGTVTSDIKAGSHTATLSSGHGLKAGDTVYLEQANTVEYLLANGWSNVSFSDADDKPFREAILVVKSIAGNTVTFETAVPYAMEGGLATFSLCKPVTNVTLSDFTVTYEFGTANPNNFINTLPAYDGLSAIFLDRTKDATLQRLSVVDAASNGFVIASTIGLLADDLFVKGSHNKGGGAGNGYGIELHEAMNNVLQNLEIYDTRHAFLFSSWHAETDNIVGITATNRDINFHGSPDKGNVVTVQRSELSYDPSQNEGPEHGAWAIVNGGGSKHAKTDFFLDNTVSFVVGIGHVRADKMHAIETGGYLNGMDGNDTLIGRRGGDTLAGGSGNDTLTGGAGRDELSGGAGRDIFIFQSAGDSGMSSGSRDTVSGLVSGYGDRIDLSRIDANATVSGNNAFALDTGGAFGAGEIALERVSGGILASLNTDSDVTAEMQFFVAGVSALRSADFIL